MAALGQREPFKRWNVSQVELRQEARIAEWLPILVQPARPLCIPGEVGHASDPAGSGFVITWPAPFRNGDVRTLLRFGQQQINGFSQAPLLGARNQLFAEVFPDHNCKYSRD